MHTRAHMPINKGQQKTFGGDGYIALILMVVTQIYLCVQTHQILCIKYLQFLLYQLYFNILFKKFNDPLPEYWL